MSASHRPLAGDGDPPAQTLRLADQSRQRRQSVRCGGHLVADFAGPDLARPAYHGGYAVAALEIRCERSALATVRWSLHPCRCPWRSRCWTRLRKRQRPLRLWCLPDGPGGGCEILVV